MWLWDVELHALGFRRQSDRYWVARGRFGLAGDDHISIFSWSEQAIPNGKGRPRFLVELTEFHVTVEVGRENLHFYYHERGENEWESGGHTSRAEVERLGIDADALRADAGEVAAAFVAALGGSLY